MNTTEKIFLILLVSLSFISYSDAQSDDAGIHTTYINDGDGYMYFDLTYDSIHLVNLSNELSSQKKKDTCYFYLDLTALKDYTLIKKSIRYKCKGETFISKKVVYDFFSGFNPKVGGEIGINYDYDFSLSLIHI